MFNTQTSLLFDHVQLYSNCHAKCFNDLRNPLSVILLSPPPPPGNLYLSLVHELTWGCYWQRGGGVLLWKCPWALLCSEKQASMTSHGKEIQILQGPCLQPLSFGLTMHPLHHSYIWLLASHWKLDHLFLPWSFVYFSDSSSCFTYILQCLYL